MDPTEIAPRPRASGQMIVLFALGLVTFLAAAALVIDAGAAFAQQRIAQNGSDASANAGTLIVAEKLSGAARTGADVANAINAVAAANGLEAPTAEYTDKAGTPFSPEVAIDLAAPAANGAIPNDARGVHVGGQRTAGTTFARVIGITSLVASADATAIAGAVEATCPPDAGCVILPVTFPVTVAICDSQGILDNTFYGIGAPPPGDPTAPYWPVWPSDQMTEGHLAIVPLCKIDPGSVGWLDLGPGNLADEISNPSGGSVILPNWFHVQTGNPNSVEDEINDNYMDKTVLVPMFDGTCRVNPGPGTPYEACPEDKKGVDPTGDNTWYHIPAFTAFHIYQAYIAGANVEACSSLPGSPTMDPSTPGFLGCIKGWFVKYLTDSPVNPDADINPSTSIGIQLVK